VERKIAFRPVPRPFGLHRLQGCARAELDDYANAYSSLRCAASLTVRSIA